MQHVSVNKWPGAAQIKTNNHTGIHSVNFCVCSANFRVCSGNFRVCFWRQCAQKIACPNSPIDTAAKPCHRLLRAFNHPINSRWVQTTMPQYMNLCYDISWTSDPSGNVCANDSFSLNLFFCLSSWRPRRPNKQAVSVYSNYEDFGKKKRLCLWTYVKKRNHLEKHCCSNKYIFLHSYGCLGIYIYIYTR